MDAIGNYEYSKKDLIGHGAFAIVYKGRQRAVRFITHLTHKYVYINVAFYYECFCCMFFRHHKKKWPSRS